MASFTPSGVRSINIAREVNEVIGRAFWIAEQQQRRHEELDDGGTALEVVVGIYTSMRCGVLNQILRDVPDRLRKDTRVVVIHSCDQDANEMKNVEFRKVDDISNALYEDEFDVIVSPGELHRHYTPCHGHGLILDTMYTALRPGGTMLITTYTSEGNYGVDPSAVDLYVQQDYENWLQACEVEIKTMEKAFRVVQLPSTEYREYVREWWNRELGCDQEQSVEVKEALLTMEVFKPVMFQPATASDGSKLTLGLWMTQTKLDSFIWKRRNQIKVGFGYYLRKRGVDMVPVMTDLSEPGNPRPYVSASDAQKKINVVLQKDEFALGLRHPETEDGDSESRVYLPTRTKTSLSVVDDPSQAKWLYNRVECAERSRKVLKPPPYAVWANSDDLQGTFVNDVKHYQSWLSTRLEKIKFPVVAKPVDAEAHLDLQIVFELEGLKNLAPRKLGWMLQEFIPHNDVLFKVSVIGKLVYISQRPTVTAKFIKENKGQLNVSMDRISNISDKDLDFGIKWAVPPREEITRVSYALQQALGLSIFGYDWITSTETGQHYIIDINYFPSFSDVPSKNYWMLQHLLSMQ